MSYPRNTDAIRHISAIPVEELLNDRAASLMELDMCEKLFPGRQGTLFGRPVADVIRIDHEIVSTINAELDRRTIIDAMAGAREPKL